MAEISDKEILRISRILFDKTQKETDGDVVSTVGVAILFATTALSLLASRFPPKERKRVVSEAVAVIQKDALKVNSDQ